MSSLISCPNVGCRMTFKYRMEKKRHLESNKCKGTLPDNKKPIVKMDGESNSYLCLNCNKTIKHKNNIGRHKKLCKQGQVKPLLVCDVCNKHFKFKSKFEIHKKIHTRTVFNCRSCDKNFKRSDHLATMFGSSTSNNG